VFDAQIGYVFFGCRAWTPMVINTYGVAFAASRGPAFVDGRPRDELRQTIEQVRNSNPSQFAFALEAEWTTDYDHTVVLASRRTDYDDAARQLLQQLNENLRGDRIEVRSYDWLIEACLSIDEQHK
jgi:hypothetical protein